MQFVILAMEGPDLYSLAGGLGVRVTELSRCLADMGYPTHLFFIGDPALPSIETSNCLTLHRWCQWLSVNYPKGVYDGEREKIRELETAWPQYVIKEIVEPGREKGIFTVFLTEDWQTVQTTINLGKLLREKGLQRTALILWNANNSYGFSEINWKQLQEFAVITAVSRYMKHLMWQHELNPIVIRNGIPKRTLLPVPQQEIDALRVHYPGLLLTKVGRYSVDKRWIMAVEAVGELKRRGYRPRFIVRGGKEEHREAVQQRARQLGLKWQEIPKPDDMSNRGILEALSRCDSDIYELCFHVPEDFIRVLYAGADCVLANSGHEPFGLVGLEVMACGGVVFVGSTGEDYASNLINCISIETSDPREIAVYVEALQVQREMASAIRYNGKINAEAYTWDKVAAELFLKINFLAFQRGLLLNE
ncbi:MAG: glycosyltransferase family 4 protein [bacterium]|nr:glycosyltransferase family 4 protein [bacterium]